MVSVWAAAEDRPAFRRWRALPVLTRDAVVTAALAAIVLQPVLDPVGAVLGDLEPRRMDLLGGVLLAALWAPLAIRRRWPALALAVIATAFGVHELLGYPTNAATLALFFATYSAGAHQRRWRTPLVLVASAGYAGLAVFLDRAGSPTPTVGFLTVYLFLVGCWAAGSWIRARQTGAEERRLLSVDAALAAERARIARELHDVVTHHVTAMVVQADAAQFVTGAAAVATGLAAISDTGRLALADLRHLLGVLSAPGQTGPGEDGAGAGAERTPMIGPILELVEQARRSGQPVELTEDGEQPDLPGGAELAVYRVVQEALTNAIKHAPGRATSVRVRHASDEAEIEVLTAGPGDPQLPSARRPSALVGGGRGLRGMHERVAVFGGELVAAPTSDGGFQVRARIPRDEA
jgi:signal transduction histidine kinase